MLHIHIKSKNKVSLQYGYESVSLTSSYGEIPSNIFHKYILKFSSLPLHRQCPFDPDADHINGIQSFQIYVDFQGHLV